MQIEAGMQFHVILKHPIIAHMSVFHKRTLVKLSITYDYVILLRYVESFEILSILNCRVYIYF